jgi:hypothetical protein
MTKSMATSDPNAVFILSVQSQVLTAGMRSGTGFWRPSRPRNRRPKNRRLPMAIARDRTLASGQIRKKRGGLDAIGSQTYHEKKLKAWAVDVPKSTSSTSTSFGFITMKNQNLTYLVHRGQS